ncbi:type VI secretion system membrane subunit TssM [Photobacterium makurazakiensis]|uniref:type VI secretion system membrane subunit TssM n=1 Tax=Photobacterium makurazakiensis TaxID=2910234 RepID=UPI003D0A640A
MGKSKAIIFSSLLALATAGITCVALWSLGWYSFTPQWLLILEVIAIVLEMALVGGGMFYFLRRPKPVVDEDNVKRQQRQAQAIKSRFSVIWKNHSGLNANPYQIPWYIHLTNNLNEDTTFLRQVGFEAVESSEVSDDTLSPVHFWGSDNAVLISIDLSHPQETVKESIATLFDLVMKKRERQAINGVLCTLNLKTLAQSDEIAVNETSLKYRGYLADFNSRTGLSIPTYCIFTHLAGIKDCCELFSTLSEVDREQPFGALRPAIQGSGYDKGWFDTSFDDLIQRLSVTMSEALKQQLNDDYRESTVSGIFQLSALRFDIEDFLAATFNQHQFDDVALHFRGYFLLNAGGESTATDILTFMNAAELGFDSLASDPAIETSLSLFSKKLFRSCIINEANLVGVYRAKEWRYRFSRIAILACLALVLSFFVLLLQASYESQQKMDNKALVMLERYKENLKNNVIVPDDLSSPVFSLSELRAINLLYQKDETPWYDLSEWLPDSSIKTYVESAYYQELNSVLLTIMRDYILKDMFVYNSLDDKVKTLELLNYHQLLYNPNRRDVGALVNYYIAALKEEGEGDAVLLEHFESLAMDALNSGAVPPQSDAELLALVRASLSLNDMSELLYQHIMQHPNFSRRIDIRKQLSPAYKSIFTFTSGFSGYLVPYVFTREGFDELTNETGLQLASEATQAYEGVMGRISGEAEMNRINRQLRERYINDYVKFWKSLTANVVWAEVTTWGETTIQLEVATDPLYSPLAQLYRLIDTHTRLANRADSISEKKAEGGENPNALRSDTIERVANSIAMPFLNIHQLLAASDTGQSKLAVALKQLRLSLEWIENSKEVRSRGEYYLEQLKNADTSTPIAHLYKLSNNYDDPILPILMRGQALMINELALSASRTYINEDWDSIYRFYNKRFKGRYPFDKQSMFDTSISDFEDFFKRGGLFDNFVQKYDGYFDSGGFGETVIRGFIPHQNMIVSNQYRSLEATVQRLQRGIFSNDKVGFEFLLKADRMSPSLTRFSIESGNRLFEYKNGPLLWRKQSWPIVSNGISDISIVTRDNNGAGTREKLAGEWGWFRVADKMQGSNIVGTDNLAWQYLADNNYVNLIVKSNGREQPFSPRFFQGLELPEKL